VFPAFEKELWYQYQVVEVKNNPADYCVNIIKPDKVLANLPSFNEIYRQTQKNSPGKKVKKDTNFIAGEKVFHNLLLFDFPTLS